jgi:hypothetical protein
MESMKACKHKETPRKESAGTKNCGFIRIILVKGVSFPIESILTCICYTFYNILMLDYVTVCFYQD